ncbi:hypothetical protein [Streptomyces sp. NPDC048419]|uniref:hypothetical protein n=1 Tax=Streptomyces sp. NPDC048419 TaxID=3365547 RepID=UPI0037232105
MEIVTLHDPAARYSQKVIAAGQRDWTSYRDHQTGTCDETSPHVIVQAVTRPAPQQDIGTVDDIRQRLTHQGFQPLEHVVDGGGGDVTPDSIHQTFQKWDIPLLGPVRADPQAARRPGGFTKKDIAIAWEARTLTCRTGHQAALESHLGRRTPPGCPSSFPAGHAGNARTG